MSGEVKATTKTASGKRGGDGSSRKSKKSGERYPPSLRAEDDNGLGIIPENEQSPKKLEESTIRNMAMELDCPVYLHQEQLPTTPSSRKSDDGKRQRKSALSSEARTLLRKNLLLESSSTHLSPKGEALANKEKNVDRPRDKNEVKCERSNIILASPHQMTPTKLKLKTDAASSRPQAQKSPARIKSPYKASSRISSPRKENDSEQDYHPTLTFDKAENHLSKLGGDAPELPPIHVDVNNEDASKGAKATQDEKLKSIIAVAADEAAGRLTPRTRRRTVCNPAVVAATTTRHLGSTTRRAGGRAAISSSGNRSFRQNGSAQHNNRSKGTTPAAAAEPGANATSLELPKIPTSKQSKVETHPKEAKETTSGRTRGASRNRNTDDTKDSDPPKQRNPPTKTASGRTPRSPARAHHRRTLKLSASPAAAKDSKNKNIKNKKGLPSASASSHSRTSKSSVDSCHSAVSVTTSSGLIW